MDIKKYIASGILENYILGLASEAERQEVERYAAEYPEIRAELEAIELAVEDYAIIHEVKTPDGVEAKINAQIDKLEELEKKKLNQNKDKDSNNRLNWLLGGLLLISAILAFLNYQKVQTQTAAANRLQSELTTLQTNCDQTTQENQALKEQLLILQDPDNQPVIMDGNSPGTNKAPNAIATVHWNQVTQKSYISLQSLPPNPSGKRYQLWAIVGGTPQDMGQFDVTTDTTQLLEVPFIVAPQAFAVTLEDAGDNTTPTLTEMYVLGTVGG